MVSLTVFLRLLFLPWRVLFYDLYMSRNSVASNKHQLIILKDLTIYELNYRSLKLTVICNLQWGQLKTQQFIKDLLKILEVNFVAIFGGK